MVASIPKIVSSNPTPIPISKNSSIIFSQLVKQKTAILYRAVSPVNFMGEVIA